MSHVWHTARRWILLDPVIAALCTLVAAYVVARALLVPFSYDEGASYLRYVSQDFWSVFNFEVATNHFLNTLLTRAVSIVAGDSEFALRVPSLIGFGIYLYFTIRILDDVPRGPRRVAGFVLLTFNPYLLDYFAMSRGYGLSLGFLMGAVFYLLRFAGPTITLDRGRDLSRALAFGCAGVLANFSLLDAYFGLIAVALLQVVTVRAAEEAPSPPWFRWRTLALPVVAALFLFLVLFEDRQLSEQLYEPITVSVPVLTPAEADGVRVFGIGLRERGRALTRSPGTAVWRLATPGLVQHVRIEFPARVGEKVAASNSLITIVIGGHPFVLRPGSEDLAMWGDERGLVVYDSRPQLSLPRSRMALYAPAINWRGNRTHLAVVAKATGVRLAMLAALGAALWVIGTVLTRARLVTASGWRVLMTGILWLTAVAAVPLYLLRRDNQLYFGGTIGFVTDTFGSLLEGSLYGRTYFASQMTVVLAAVVATMMAFVLVLPWSYRRKPAVARSVSYLLLMLAVASAAVIAQHRVFDTPFLFKRTALFYIPLFMLCVVFGCGAIAALGRIGRTIATSLIVVAAALATVHFALTANVSYVWDFKADAGTKAMVDDLTLVIANERAAGSRIILGVEPAYSGAAAYYSQRVRTATIEMDTIPTSRTVDFFYVDESDAGSLRVIKKYPIAGTVLARPDR